MQHPLRAGVVVRRIPVHPGHDGHAPHGRCHGQSVGARCHLVHQGFPSGGDEVWGAVAKRGRVGRQLRPLHWALRLPYGTSTSARNHRYVPSRGTCPGSARREAHDHSRRSRTSHLPPPLQPRRDAAVGGHAVRNHILCIEEPEHRGPARGQNRYHQTWFVVRCPSVREHRMNGTGACGTFDCLRARNGCACRVVQRDLRGGASRARQARPGGAWLFLGGGGGGEIHLRRSLGPRLRRVRGREVRGR